MGWWDALRQWQFPREFRIGPSPWPGGWEERWAALLQALKELGPEAGGSLPPAASPPETWFRSLAELSTNIWRLRQKMVPPGAAEPLPEMRRPFRHVETVLDILQDMGLRIMDHTGERWVDGLAIKVIAYQPTPGTNFEMVLETIRPTIYFQDRHIQMGEVIVATPPAEAAAGRAAPPEKEGEQNS